MRNLWSFSLILLLSCTTGPVNAGKNNTGEPITDLIEFCTAQKGFNLLGKFDVSWSNEGYKEDEFRLIHELGFNFVRLPLDYRSYTQTGNWDLFIENEVAEIDKAIEWGIQYDVHVSINIHRAPGYCVNPATLPVNQQLNLWTDSIAQNAFVNHWEFFADRYKDVPPANLSFNLVNEPSNVAEGPYLLVMQKAIRAIRDISPDRIIFVDGLDYGRNIIPALKDEPNVAQSIHCYDPFNLTHYKAEWVEGSDTWPVPGWPMLWISNYLYGPWKTEFKSPLIIEGNFPAGTEVTVNVRQVSIESTLQVKANTSVILNKKFLCGPDTGADFSQIVQTQWGYQNISNKDFSATLTSAATRLSFENVAGDWMILNSISIKQNGIIRELILSDNSWGNKQSTYILDENGEIKTPDGKDLLPFDTYRTNIEIAKQNNIALMVQEFGVHNQTPHDVTVRFLADLTGFLQENNIGWALWNFAGSFGILNSSRSDCSYEPWQGYQLDRDMLQAITYTSNTQGRSPENHKTLSIFPSLARDKLTISNHSLHGKSILEIRDMSGRLVKTFTIDALSTQSIQLDISGMSPNLYLLNAINKRTVYTGKFLIL